MDFPRYRIRTTVWQPDKDLDPIMEPTPRGTPVQAHIDVTLVIRRFYLSPLDGALSPVNVDIFDVPYCFPISAFEDYDAVSGLLSKLLTWFGIPSDLHFQIITPLVRHGRRAAAWLPNSTRMWVPMEADISVEVTERMPEEEELERVLALSAAEAEEGMVPAAEGAVKKMLKRVRVADAGEEGMQKKRRKRRVTAARSCAICMEDFPAGSRAAEMPCSHVFHKKCIVRWLKESHYCPLCRYEMPK